MAKAMHRRMREYVSKALFHAEFIYAAARVLHSSGPDRIHLLERWSPVMICFSGEISSGGRAAISSFSSF